jgi:hypothetical protein
VKKTEIMVAVALVVASVFTGGVVEAKRGPSAVTVCVDAATGVVSRVAASATCVGESQKWSASKLAPELCWNASSVNPKSQTRLVSIKPSAGCVAPLRSVPVGKLVLLCADQISGVLRWSVTRACEVGNANTWVRVGALRNAAPASVTTTTTTVALVPSVSLQTTLIQGNTWPRAVTVTATVAGTIYFVEGSVTVKSVSDITNSHPMLWAQGAVAAANTATSITFNVENLVNGYYRVYVVNAQGVLSAPATNIVTISVHPASQATSTTSTTVAVRVQTLDQSYSMWDSSNSVVSSSQSMGQSFTAGLSGPLSRIAVGITSYGTVSQITAKIYATIAGNATGPALASTFIDSTTVPTVSGGALTVFDFASPASVVAGSQYVIVLTTPDAMSFDMDTFAQVGGYYLWYGGVGNFSGETGISNPITSPSSVNYGLMFQTYVNA